MLFADYADFGLVVHILHLGIVILIPMHHSGLFDEFFGGQLLAHNLNECNK
jgi:hypothetical protein